MLRSRLKARLLTQRDRDAALGYLKREAHHNLLLIEMAASVGHAPTPSEQPPRVVAAWRGGEVVGVASLRPSVVVDYAMSSEVRSGLVPFRPRARLMKLIGAELISDDVVAMTELVKNAHDADASIVAISFKGVTGARGEIIVSDDGNGMDLGTLMNQEADRMVRGAMTEDYQEAVKAFMEKRAPVFRGR